MKGPTEISADSSLEIIGPRFRAAALLAASCLLAGCHIGPKNFQNENDKLRSENQKLRQRAADLDTQLELRLAQIDRLEQVGPGRSAVPGAEVPRFVAAKYDTYTGFVAVSEADKALLRLYVLTLDQKGRFIPVGGSAVVKVIGIPADKPPVQLAEKVFDPASFDDAYRDGLTGTHYTLELAMPPLPAEYKEVTVRVMITDGATGITTAAEGVFKPTRNAR